MILVALELGLRDPKFHESALLPTIDLHVEHVLAQSWQQHWPLKLEDPVAAATRDTMLHSVGNLTLLTASFMLSYLQPEIPGMVLRIDRPGANRIRPPLCATTSYGTTSASIAPRLALSPHRFNFAMSGRRSPLYVVRRDGQRAQSSVSQP